MKRKYVLWAHCTEEEERKKRKNRNWKRLKQVAKAQSAEGGGARGVPLVVWPLAAKSLGEFLKYLSA